MINVQDVYPESLILQGRMLAKTRLAGWMRRLDGVIARGSGAVIVISNRFADLYRTERRVPPERVHVVPNWGDGRAVQPDDKSVDPVPRGQRHSSKRSRFCLRRQYRRSGWVETLIQATMHLKKASDFRLLIAGEGSRLSACQALAQRLDDVRLVFHTPWRLEETALVLGLAEVLLLPTQGQQSLVSVPSKLIAYWLAGRPVIALAWPHNDLAEYVEKSGGGWLVDPDRPDLLAAKIQEVMNLSSCELRRRGEMGRDFAARNLTQETCLPHVLTLLEKAGVK